MKVSVIITAYNRKDFILQAINSVISQSVDKMLYEIITITNFEYSPESVPKNLKLKRIFMEGSVGEFLQKGIEASEGEIIAFLDDDDLWQENRLEKIVSIFSSVQGISYYHNSQRYIDESGNEISHLRLSGFNKRFRKHPSLIVDVSNINRIMKLLKFQPFSNLSSIAINRITAKSILPLLGNIEGSTDIFFFWCSIIFGTRLYIDSERSTLYRLHSLNSSFSFGYQFKAREHLRMRNTYVLLNGLSLATSNKNQSMITTFLGCQSLNHKILNSIFSRSPRLSVLKDLVMYRKCVRVLNDDFTIQTLGMCVAYLFSPGLSLFIFGKLRQIESMKNV